MFFCCCVYFFFNIIILCFFFFFFQAEDGIRDFHVTGVQTCALPIYGSGSEGRRECRCATSRPSEEYCPNRVSASEERLITGFNLGRDQAHLIDTGGMRDIDDLCHFIERKVWISLDEHHFLRAGLENVVQTASQVLPRDVVLIDL